MKKMILISIILMSFMSFAQESDFGNSESDTDVCVEMNDSQIDKGSSEAQETADGTISGQQ